MVRAESPVIQESLRGYWCVLYEGCPIAVIVSRKIRAGEIPRGTNLCLFVQLRAFLFDALRHSRGELCGSERRISKVSQGWPARVTLHTLSCSNTASDSHFTLASRARTSTALRADVDESWLARKQSCSPCCNAFLDCSTNVTR